MAGPRIVCQNLVLSADLRHPFALHLDPASAPFRHTPALPILLCLLHDCLMLSTQRDMTLGMARGGAPSENCPCSLKPLPTVSNNEGAPASLVSYQAYHPHPRPDMPLAKHRMSRPPEAKPAARGHLPFSKRRRRRNHICLQCHPGLNTLYRVSQ